MEISKIAENGNEINVEYGRRGAIIRLNGKIKHVIDDDFGGPTYYAYRYGNDGLLHSHHGEFPYSSSLKYVLTEVLTLYIKGNYHINEILTEEDKNNVREIIASIKQDSKIK